MIHTHEQQVMLDQMNEINHARKSIGTHYVCNWFPSLAEIKETVNIGSFSWSAQKSQRHWHKKAHITNIGGGIVTPAELARDYLTLKYPKRDIRITARQGREVVDVHRFAPLYSRQVALPDAVYVDIRSAYWSIIRAVGWDVDYSPGHFLGVRSDNSDFPVPEIKLARNSLVTVGLPGKVTVWREGKIIQYRKPNKFINTLIWALCMDILHAVASEMLSVGAVYVHTDGYILPDDKAHLAHEVVESWGLPSSVKWHGAAQVYGVGDYEFFGQRPRTKRTIRQYAYSNIDHNPKPWLKDKFRRWAELRQITN